MQVAFTKTVQPREQKRDGRRLENLSMEEKLPARQERGGGTEAAPTWVVSVIHSAEGQAPQRHSFSSDGLLTVLSVPRNSPESPSLSRYCFLYSDVLTQPGQCLLITNHKKTTVGPQIQTELRFSAFNPLLLER